MSVGFAVSDRVKARGIPRSRSVAVALLAIGWLSVFAGAYALASRHGSSTANGGPSTGLARGAHASGLTDPPVARSQATVVGVAAVPAPPMMKPMPKRHRAATVATPASVAAPVTQAAPLQPRDVPASAPTYTAPVVAPPVAPTAPGPTAPTGGTSTGTGGSSSPGAGGGTGAGHASGNGAAGVTIYGGG